MIKYAKINENAEISIFPNGKIPKGWIEVTYEEYEEAQAEKERERISRLSLSKREVFLALYRAKGITPEQLKEEITDTEALIEFEYANEYFRFNPLIDLIGAKLGYTAADLDYLFINKELPSEQATEQVKEEIEGEDV